jgi:D-glycero-alpha-D-manno-heptose-7-phosphate kinase
VVVALVAALQQLTDEPGPPVPGVLARAAHDVETLDLGRQSGVQDQVAAAFGGANLVTISPYPSFDVVPVEVRPDVLEALARRVVTVYLGSSHDSSAVHDEVIADLVGDDTKAEQLLAPLRACAKSAAAALAAGDVELYAQSMTANTEAQAALHPSLINPVARQVIDIAAQCGASGWKVNGAGGAGGTVTVVGPEDPDRFTSALAAASSVSVLPLRPTAVGAQVVDRD